MFSVPARFLFGGRLLFFFFFFFFLKKKNTAKMDLFLIFLKIKNCRRPSLKIARMSGKMYRAAILKEKKGPPPSYFSKKQDTKHVVQVNSIERLQRRALGIITGTFPDTMSYAQLLQSLSVVRLSERRSVLCEKFAKSLLISDRHRHLLPETRQTISRRTLRNSLQLNTPKMRTERYRQSPIPHFTQILNSNL